MCIIKKQKSNLFILCTAPIRVCVCKERIFVKHFNYLDSNPHTFTNTQTNFIIQERKYFNKSRKKKIIIVNIHKERKRNNFSKKVNLISLFVQ
jgi:hypothetical protein